MKIGSLKHMAVMAALLAVIAVAFGVGVGFVESSILLQQSEIPFPDVQDSLQAAAAWLEQAHQNDDGGYSSFSAGANSAPSDVGGTLDALIALSVAGRDVDPQLDYLAANLDQAAEYAAVDGSTAGKLVIGLTVAGANPRDFQGNDYVITLSGHLSPTGQYGVTTAFNQSLAILGLAATGEEAPPESFEWLLGLQESDGELAGSWDDGFGTAGNPDSTAMALLALIAGENPETIDEVDAAISFLASSQLDSGGWEYAAGLGENANSTALVVQALSAAGEDLTSADSPWTKNNITPVTALLAWQGEIGAFQADYGEGRFDDFFSTVQAMPALAVVTSEDQQVFAPALSAEVEEEQSASATEVAAVEETEVPDTASEESTELEQTTDSDAGDTGTSLCSAPLMILFLAGIFVLAPAGRRRISA